MMSLCSLPKLVVLPLKSRFLAQVVNQTTYLRLPSHHNGGRHLSLLGWRN